MKSLEEIKNEYAKEQCVDNWVCLISMNGYNEFEKHINNICMLAQKQALKNASENANLQKYNSNKEKYSFIDGYYNGLGIAYTVNKESITNENNLVK